jgi:hypothetical protein
VVQSSLEFWKLPEHIRFPVQRYRKLVIDMKVFIGRLARIRMWAGERSRAGLKASFSEGGEGYFDERIWHDEGHTLSV